MARPPKQKLQEKPTTKQIQYNLTHFVNDHGKSLAVGSIALLVSGLLLGSFLVTKRNTLFPQVSFPTKIPLTIFPEPSPTPALTPIQTRTDVTKAPLPSSEQKNMTNKKPLVKTLPDTASDTIFYTITSGDSLAKLGKKFCHDSRAYLYIERDNNLIEPYMLQPGDSITIMCR